MTYNVQLWDIAGQERFGNMTRIYLRDATAVIVVCDITRPQTYHSSVKWRAEILSILDKNIPMILVINKNDLKDTVDRHANYPPDIGLFAQENGFCFYREISVKNDESKINDIFDDFLEIIKRESPNETSKVDDNVDLQMKPFTKTSGRGCC